MSERCANERCFVHDGDPCYEGHESHSLCDKWRQADPAAAGASAPQSAPVTARVPWSGNGLGPLDLANLTPRGRSILVGVLGAHDAGKTTLLLGNYLRLLRGHTLADACFAGSRTLGAWETLAAWTRLDDSARPPNFPPHTSRNAGRVPSLLHLALRGADGGLRDVLLTDAPGEWFTGWSIREEGLDAEGARWIARNADAFLVFADCERLAEASPERGKARRQLRELLERLGNHVGDRPTVLVWAKCDHQPSRENQKAIRDTLSGHIPRAFEAESTTTRLDSLADVLEQVLRVVWTPPRAVPVVEPVLHSQPFTAFRGSYAQA